MYRKLLFNAIRPVNQPAHKEKTMRQHFRTMTNEEYHRAEGVSKSGLDLINRSPAHFRYSATREPTRSMTLGTATHAAILEPELYASQYIALPEGVDRRSSVYKEAIKERGEDSILTRGEADRIDGMTASVRSNLHASAILSAGYAEQSIFATDPETGVIVRIRPDWISAGLACLDLKTAADASDDGFAKSVANYRYHVQQAFYTDVFKWATGDKFSDFGFLVVESDLPHSSTIIRLPDDVVAYGRKLYRRNLNTYAECLNRDEWPGIPQAPHVIGMPGWFVNEMESEMEVSYE